MTANIITKEIVVKTYPKVYLNKKFILDALAKQNITVAEFAESIQCEQSQLSNWLSGKIAVSPKPRRSILKTLNCTWEQVFSYKTKK